MGLHTGGLGSGQASDGTDFEDYAERAYKQLWVAPELLRQELITNKGSTNAIGSEAG